MKITFNFGLRSTARGVKLVEGKVAVVLCVAGRERNTDSKPLLIIKPLTLWSLVSGWRCCSCGTEMAAEGTCRVGLAFLGFSHAGLAFFSKGYFGLVLR